MCYLGVPWGVWYTLACTYDCECTILLLTIVVTLLWLQHMLDCRVAMWNQPSKTYGFWNTDRANAKYHTQLYSDFQADIILMKTDSQAYS